MIGKSGSKDGTSVSSANPTSAPLAARGDKHPERVRVRPSFRVAYGSTARVSLVFPDQGKTDQSARDECDINTIMARYARTGVLPAARDAIAQYADVSALDFQQAQLLVAGAMSAFEELPSELRSRFGNEPAALLGFLENPANRAEAIKLGLVKPDAPSGAGVAPPPLCSGT